MTRFHCGIFLVLAAGSACASGVATAGDAGAGVSMDAGARSDAGSPSDAGATPDGGPTADGGCARIGGVYVFSGSSSCTNGLTPPMYACIAQDGCDVAVTTDDSVLKGTLSDSMLQVADSSEQTTCTGIVQSDGTASLNCSNAALSSTCSLQAAPTAPPMGYENICCDLAAQNCPNGETCRPGFMSVGNGFYVNQCYQPTGNVAAGGRCTRASSAVSADNCAAGLICTKDGAPAGELVCGSLCTGTCAAGELCQELPEYVPTGICVGSCDVFASTDSCGTGLRCGTSVVVTPSLAFAEVCLQQGSTAAGGACTTELDCGPGLDCYQGASDSGRVCHPFCNSAHPCSGGGQTCVTWHPPAGDVSFGVCDPFQ